MEMPSSTADPFDPPSPSASEMITDGFTPLAFTSLCSNITNRGIACVSELRAIIQNLAQDDHNIHLRSLADGLDSLSKKVEQLERALNAATVICQRLQNDLQQILSNCDTATGVLSKQIMRLQPANLIDIDWAFVLVYKELIQAQFHFLHYLARSLNTLESDQQKQFLALPRAAELRDQADSAFRLTKHLGTSILIHEEPNDAQDITLGVSSVSLGDGAAPPKSNDEPPPYSPADASSSPSSPNTALAEDVKACPSGSKGFSFSASFKALTSALRPKPDPLVSALCQAIKLGDERQVTGLLSQGANVNGRSEDGTLPLHCATVANQPSIARVLLSHGADWKSSGWTDLPPLFFAASVGNVEVAKAILERGARVDEKNISGQPYFVDVVSSANVAGVQFLLEHGANANASNLSGRPVIASAVRKNSLPLLEVLLRYGADVNACDMTGGSLLAIAGEQENLDMAYWLLEHGAKGNSRNLSGITVLADAISKRRLEFARKLLECGADPNAKDLYGQSALVMILRDDKIEYNDKVRMVELLLERGASPNHSDMVGRPALSYAIESGSPELVGLLVGFGAKNRITMPGGETPLLYAMERNSPEIVQLLLDGGVDPNMKDKRGRTPLIQALLTQDDDMVKMLRQYGADVQQEGVISPSVLASSMGRANLL
ncbi:ankyrin repeat protein [Stachybotrys elegans]|uniref:Ankyrin repeat protein n=1 Tax=Stachybotrys elegans TaxID=80388 RepID=A0A8K0SHQ3_9HYPO|nr:ankyrin repeat protein [Stachybotrys elegans]